MTVGEMIAELNKLPNDMVLVMSRDAEGNTFRPVDEVEDALYHEDRCEVIHEDDRDECSWTCRAAVIWPEH